MQTEESQSKFHFNQQGLAIVVIVLLALGVPILALLLAFHLVSTPPKPATVPPDNELRATLTQISEKSLPAGRLEDGKTRMTVQVKSFDQSQKDIEVLAARYQGVAVLTDSTDTKRVLLIHLAEERAGEFVTDLKGMKGIVLEAEEVAPQAGLLEITLKPAS